MATNTGYRLVCRRRRLVGVAVRASRLGARGLSLRRAGREDLVHVQMAGSTCRLGLVDAALLGQEELFGLGILAHADATEAERRCGRLALIVACVADLTNSDRRRHVFARAKIVGGDVGRPVHGIVRHSTLRGGRSIVILRPKVQDVAGSLLHDLGFPVAGAAIRVDVTALAGLRLVLLPDLIVLAIGAFYGKGVPWLTGGRRTHIRT